MRVLPPGTSSRTCADAGTDAGNDGSKAPNQQNPTRRRTGFFIVQAPRFCISST
jgi:hypothetical protein